MNPVRHLMTSVASLKAPALPTVNLPRFGNGSAPVASVDADTKLRETLGPRWRYATAANGAVPYITNGKEGAPHAVIYQAGFSVRPVDLELMARVIETGVDESVDTHVAVMFMKPRPLIEHAEHVGVLANELFSGRPVTTISQSAGSAVCRVAAALYPTEITHHIEFNSVGNARMWGAKHWFRDLELQVASEAAMALGEGSTDEMRFRDGVRRMTIGDEKEMARAQSVLGKVWRTYNDTVRSAEFAVSGLTGPYALAGLSNSAVRLAEFFKEDREAATAIKALCSALWVQPYLEHIAELRESGKKTPHFLMARSAADTVCQRHMFNAAREIMKPYCALELPRLSHGLGHAPPAVRHLIPLGKAATQQLHQGEDPSVVANRIYAEGPKYHMPRQELGKRWSGSGPVGLEPRTSLAD